jgi:hypothetical protein
VHDPDASDVVQLDGPTNTADAPPPFTNENEITVPAGAFTGPAPFPLSTFTCPVNVWFDPTGFVADCGEIWMFASTHVFVASPEFPARPLVSTENAAPPTVTIDDA